MYAIIEAGGRQWKVEPGTRLDINRVTTDVGASHVVEQVLLASDGQQVKVGRPYLEGARVLCEVVEHRLGPKEISYHFRRRENWRKTVGHRQPLTRLVVKDIIWPGAVPSAASATAEAPVKPRAAKPVKPKTTEASKASAVVKKPKTVKRQES